LRVVPSQNLDAEVQKRRFPIETFSKDGEPPPTSGTEIEAFLERYPFFSACRIMQDFLSVVSRVKEVLKRQLGTRKCSRCSVPDFRSRTQESEVNDFEGIATGGEF
jgi:hypothetical protein